MTKFKWIEIAKGMENTTEWNKELYKHRITDLGKAVWRVMYNDGSHVDGMAGYADLKRTDVKSISVIVDGKPIHTLAVKEDRFFIRLRNLARGIVGGDSEFNFQNPKRVFILASKNSIAFVWDDGDIDELTQWGDKEPYTMPPLRSEEK